MKIEILGPDSSPHTDTWVKAFQRSGHDVRVFSVPVRRGRPSLRVWKQFFYGLLNSMRDRPDVRVIHSLGTHGLVGSVLRRAKRTVVVPWGSEVVGALDNSLRRLLIKAMLKSDSGIVVSSRSMRDCLVTEFSVHPRRIFVMSWGVDRDFVELGRKLEQRSAARVSTNDVSANPVHFVFPRGTSETYNYSLAIEAFHRVRAAGFPVRFSVVDVRRRSGEVSRAQRVRGITLLPRQSRSGLLDLYASADLVISIPSTDQRSTSVLEALATGVEVLVSDLGVYREMAEDGFQLTVLPDLSVEALTSVLVEAAQGSRRRLASNVETAALIESQQDNMRLIVAYCVKG